VIPVLELDDVAVSYGKRRALDGVSLTVSHGEIVTLLGANGAGKSTTLRAVSGLVRASRGRIRFDGRDITEVAADAIVQSLLPLVAKDDRPFRVVDDGTQIGVVDRRAVVAAMVES